MLGISEKESWASPKKRAGHLSNRRTRANRRSSPREPS